MAERIIAGNVAGRGFCALRVENGEIHSVRNLGGERRGEPYFAPGLVDLQLNGFGGVDFSDETLTVEQLTAVLPRLWKTGLTTFCPTLITNSCERLARNFRVLEEARRADPRFARAVPSYHLEGPYLSPGPSHGVHNPEWMHPPKWEEFCVLQEAAGGNIGILTLAPELPGACDFIRKARKAGVVVAIGHTDGGPEHIHQAVRAGATLSTHLGNGCAQVMDRHRNPIWAQLAEPKLHASIICDGFHLPPDLLTVIARMKGVQKTILISDATHVATLPPGRYSLVGTEIDLLPEGKVIRADGASLAGSALTMNRAVAVFQQTTSSSAADALQCATTNPARLLKRPGVCREMAGGEPANLIRYRPGEHALEVEALWLAGEMVYQQDALDTDRDG
jgi:N-acetylglucosamine-6-phosphate deacetylase